jgi:hypothetical protein
MTLYLTWEELESSPDLPILQTYVLHLQQAIGKRERGFTGYCPIIVED